MSQNLNKESEQAKKEQIIDDINNSLLEIKQVTGAGILNLSQLGYLQGILKSLITPVVIEE
jgi:hypothetical protein